MKKFLLTVVATLIGCFMTAAQTVGVAILTHGDELTAFYGNSALHQAVDAAVEGDVISLSPGVFEGFDYFSKSGLTIVGSGMEEGPSRTTLTCFNLDANNNSENFIRLTLKDVFFDNAFRTTDGNYDITLTNCWYTIGSQCDITEEHTSTIVMKGCYTGSYNDVYGFNDHFKNCDLQAYNSVLKPEELNGDVTRSRIISNCILLCTPSADSSASITNSIFFNPPYSVLPSGVRATNCKAIAHDNYFSNQHFTNEAFSKGFEAFIEDSFYELKPELAATWVDEHGEQIGLYGGPAPFSMLPNAPRFTKFNVPPRTDEDGKLPVEIEVAFPEK